MTSPSEIKLKLSETPLEEAMPSESISRITSVLGPPSGKFIKTTHGYTHFIIDEPTTLITPRKLVVCCHGLGTDTGVYDNVTKVLQTYGYTVVRYDYYNHGWSRSDSAALKIDIHVMVQQVKDVLDHVCEPGEEVPHFVGHSTGGCVSAMCAQHLPQYKIRKLSLVSPAFWANKPLAAQLGDMIPNALFALLTHPWTSKGLTAVVADAYTKNCDVAFGRAEDGSYNYPAAHEKAKSELRVKFGVQGHPYAVNGIGSVNTYVLRSDLLPGYRDTIATLSGSGVKTTLIFGTKDIIVDYNSPLLAQMSALDNVTVIPLEGQGHESLYERTDWVCDAILKGFDEA
jgi:pimeloyl-ACP methyl ester carboxylesterase